MATSTAPDFGSVHSPGFPALLDRLGGSLAVTTYQSGRLIFLRAEGDVLNTHFRPFRKPMGLALDGDRLALGTLDSVHLFRNRAQAAALLGGEGEGADACFLPLRHHVTGDVRVHEMAFVDGRLVFVNTRFSCLAALGEDISFEPLWRPPFVSALAAEDRCHLNGLALEHGKLRLVSALGIADTAQGWRERKADGGVLLSWPDGEVIARGLSMPHSPRVHAGVCYVLESGRGTLATVDLASGRIEVVCELPGFTRELAFAGGVAFVGLSKVRESVFDGLPLAQRLGERICGVYAVDLRSGRVVAMVQFSGTVEELFDVQFLPGLCRPDLVDSGHDAVANAFFLSDAAMREVGNTA